MGFVYLPSLLSKDHSEVDMVTSYSVGHVRLFTKVQPLVRQITLESAVQPCIHLHSRVTSWTVNEKMNYGPSPFSCRELTSVMETTMFKRM